LSPRGGVGQALVADDARTPRGRDSLLAQQQVHDPASADVRPRSPQVRQDVGVVAAARALLKVDPDNKEAIPALVRDLHSRDQDVRLNACSVLGAFGGKAHPAVPALVRALRDPDTARAIPSQPVAPHCSRSKGEIPFGASAESGVQVVLP